MSEETQKAWETFAELLRKDLDNLSRQINILHKAIDTYGEKAQVDLFFEESAELTKAILKVRRHGGDSERIAAIVDEIADVTICLEYLKMIYDCENAVNEKINFKIDRTAQRIAQINSRMPWRDRLYSQFTGGKG